MIVPHTQQGSARRRCPGLVNFVTALAYHFCLALPAAFTQPGDHLLAEPCTPAVVPLHIKLCVTQTLLSNPLCLSVVFPALRKSIMSQVAVKGNGKDGEGQEERELAAVDETGNRESQGYHMSGEHFCHCLTEWFLSPGKLESLFPFRRRSMERKGRRKSMELRASLSGKILPMWLYRCFSHFLIFVTLINL